jgi:hypothetical protein
VGYYVRIFSPSRARVPAAAIRKMLKAVPEVAVSFGRPQASWSQAIVSVRADPDSAVLSIERDPVTRKSLGEEEVEEFDAELKAALPRSGAKWVRSFLKKVKTVYAVQLHWASKEHPKAIEAIIEGLRIATKGIVQADFQGFSNQSGDLVVWQFSPHAKGEWTLAVLRKGNGRASRWSSATRKRAMRS